MFRASFLYSKSMFKNIHSIVIAVIPFAYLFGYFVVAANLNWYPVPIDVFFDLKFLINGLTYISLNIIMLLIAMYYREVYPDFLKMWVIIPLLAFLYILVVDSSEHNLSTLFYYIYFVAWSLFVARKLLNVYNLLQDTFSQKEYKKAYSFAVSVIVFVVLTLPVYSAFLPNMNTIYTGLTNGGVTITLVDGSEIKGDIKYEGSKHILVNEKGNLIKISTDQIQITRYNFGFQ